MSDAHPARTTETGPKPLVKPTWNGPTLFELMTIAVRPVVTQTAVAVKTGSIEGLSIAEFAALAGIDRRRLARHLVEVPPGPVPSLRSGAIPVRVFGKTRRIFLRDVFGAEGVPTAGEIFDAGSAQKTNPGSAGGASWDRSLDLLRRGGTK